MSAYITAKAVPVKIAKKTTSATNFRKLVTLSLDQLVKLSLSGKVRATFKATYKTKKKGVTTVVGYDIILNRNPK